MLRAFPVDANGGDQDEIFLDMQPVDLNGEQVGLGQVRRHPCRHALGRQLDEAARHRRLGTAVTLRCRHVAFGQTHGAAVLAGRYVDQHQVNRPLAEQVLGQRRLPTREPQLTPGAGPHTGAFDPDGATVEANLPLGLAPAVGRLAVRPPIAPTAQRSRVIRHHPGQGGNPRRQAETLETGTNGLPGRGLKGRRIGRSGCATLLHGVAFLRGFDTPSLTAQDGQRRLRYFNIGRDIPSS